MIPDFIPRVKPYGTAISLLTGGSLLRNPKNRLHLEGGSLEKALRTRELPDDDYPPVHRISRIALELIDIDSGADRLAMLVVRIP